MRKRGQFFLISALVLIVVLLSLVFYKNAIVFQRTDDEVFSLKNQILEESSVVIDYGVANNEDRLKDFLSKLSNEMINSNPELELVFFFGDSNSISVLNLAKEDIEIDIRGSPELIPSVDRDAIIKIGDAGLSFINLEDDLTKKSIKTFPSNLLEDKITFKIKSITYEISLDKYKKFYFLIRKQSTEGVDVAIE